MKVKNEILGELTLKRFLTVSKKLNALIKSSSKQNLADAITEYIGREVASMLFKDKKMKELSASEREKFKQLNGFASEIAGLEITIYKFSQKSMDEARNYAEKVYTPRLEKIRPEITEIIRSARGQAGCGDRTEEFIRTITYLVAVVISSNSKKIFSGYQALGKQG